MSTLSTPTAARLGLLQICLAGVLWGTGGLAVQLIRDITPMAVSTVSAYRMLLAAAVLVAAVLASRATSQVRDLLRRSPAHAVAVGVGTGAYQALYFAAVVHAGVTVATVVSLGLAPVLLTLAEALQRRQRPTPRQLLTLVAALVGLVLVSAYSGHAGTGPDLTLGVLEAVASGSVYAATTAFGRPLARTTDPLPLTTVTTTAGAVALLPFAALADGPKVTTDPAAVGLLLYLGVFTMALAYALLYAGLRITRSSAAVVASLMEPVTAAVAAAAVLGERLAAPGVVGTLLILGAVVLLEVEQPPDPAMPGV